MTIHLIKHIYNPAVAYIPGPSVYHQEGEVVYTHAIPPPVLDLPWPHTTQVVIEVKTVEKNHRIRGTLVGPRHVLTSGYPIYSPQGWAQEVTVITLVDKRSSPIDRAYAFSDKSEHKNPSYNIALLILHKSLGKVLGYSGLLSTSDSHLQNEKVYIDNPNILQKIEPDRVHYTPPEKSLTGTSLRIHQWQTSLVIGLETHSSEEIPYAIRMTPPKIETIAQKISQRYLKLSQYAFGKKQWAYHYGNIGEEPLLPQNIKQILKSPCPIWPGRKISETHLLTLIPETVNGQPLNLQLLGNLVQHPLQGLATKYEAFYEGQYTDPPAPGSHWTLLSRDVIPGSRNMEFKDQQNLIQKYPEYEVPNVLDTAVALFMEHVRGGNKLYSDTLWTFTRCQEKYDACWQLVAGGFGAGGLSVASYFYDSERYGIGIQRKFN